MEKEVEVAILVQLEVGVEKGLVQLGVQALEMDLVQALQMGTMDLVQKAQDLEKFCALIHSGALFLQLRLCTMISNRVLLSLCFHYKFLGIVWKKILFASKKQIKVLIHSILIILSLL